MQPHKRNMIILAVYSIVSLIPLILYSDIYNQEKLVLSCYIGSPTLFIFSMLTWFYPKWKAKTPIIWRWVVGIVFLGFLPGYVTLINSSFDVGIKEQVTISSGSGTMLSSQIRGRLGILYQKRF